ncbi:nucleotidyltransferase family protein [Ketobacter sp. MCCC 1A13808]|uniref:N-acetylmuramate alpha-1-phosphate uridylyltransferase MurU n=1 Tax=Ketobacter sp. MCCC 1A13808 TaxID=2602738 RepID=UPI000F1D0D57|nr:nucleotidyltransferase family protein [Ketobacter sp. MCCC 1A13808]MVF13092.1 nucleotidyltransferase family protein [Ketobacter sp. MCCC 1A13808]RLP52999.1 MAG: nucleotidyltransferase family protein [Ketobacter sp.]
MKAMVLAAGRGERMGELTRNCPKPLLKIARKPLLQHHLERLVAAGFDDVVVNAFYRAEDIEDFLQGWHDDRMQVHLVTEPELLETGGGIYNALTLLGEQPFLAINGDVWTDYPLASIVQKSREFASTNDLARLILVGNPDHNTGGDFALTAEGRVQNQGADLLTFSGLSVLAPALFRDCAPGRFPLGPVLRQAIERDQVSGEFYAGYWVDVGTPERLQRVEQNLKE